MDVFEISLRILMSACCKFRVGVTALERQYTSQHVTAYGSFINFCFILRDTQLNILRSVKTSLCMIVTSVFQKAPTYINEANCKTFRVKISST